MSQKSAKIVKVFESTLVFKISLTIHWILYIMPSVQKSPSKFWRSCKLKDFLWHIFLRMKKVLLAYGAISPPPPNLGLGTTQKS